MWTFLVIAIFTYIYKKCDAILISAHKEDLLAAIICLTAGMLLSYVRYFRGQTFNAPKVFQVALELLSTIPFINNFIPKSSPARTTETDSKKVSRVRKH